MKVPFADAQAGLGFVVSQTAYIEPSVYRIKFTQIQYQDLLAGCIDTSANPFAKTVTYYSQESFGGAKWINGDADDVPYGSDERSKFETQVHSAARGYSYGWEEVNQAAMDGVSLDAERAISARRAYEEFADAIALTGDASKGWEGLFNNSAVTASGATADGTGSSALWANKDADLILRDVNDALTGIQTATNNVILGDTLLLPYARFNTLASKRVPNTTMSTIEYLRQNNVFTAQTGKALTIKGVRGLDTAGSGSTARMIAFRRSPEVLKLHIPMPLRFLPVQIDGLRYKVPGVFRLGGLDVRLPKEIIYRDGI